MRDNFYSEDMILVVLKLLLKRVIFFFDMYLPNATISEEALAAFCRLCTIVKMRIKNSLKKIVVLTMASRIRLISAFLVSLIGLISLIFAF